ncbi:hypothetical protein P4493_04810 [Bacillus thuringiensis]|uniref:Uncharacterized protein n=3 Tax=Bacillus thuringiensis TaxID=1428 RepID=A0A0B5NJV9_BACTU|nr:MULTISPECIES: hypothetical protein [Bacillus]EAO56861.1 hypothetical protein RBTH_07591 [Bacillus thuringiensis serovar israelensis ATCC 35646]MEC3431668.1 hypothetical protein [Bacillus cereus]MED1153686.1 hypothetical protein [Bacillus paranthracis]OUB09439.1 hypothetical protein BK708_33510 [Bacillus thuringiensis serovar yunnanensis]AFQ30006.1 hypothetical protein BTF1_29527 [Bacillus thuringiensis HD-789]
MCHVPKCNCLSNSFYRSILEGKGRSLILGVDELFECNGDHFIKTLLNEDKYYITLSTEGLTKLLRKKQITSSATNYIINRVKYSEEEQYVRLRAYLTANREVGKKVTYIRVKDNTVITNKEYMEDFSLPLEDLLDYITFLGYKPVNLKTKEATREVDLNDVSDYVFADKRMDGLLTIFIDVTEGV